MSKRKRGNTLEKWEVAIIKAMIASKKWPNDQDILAYFTRPNRSINHRAIAEIRKSEKHAAAKAASNEMLAEFLASWPEIDPHTGLNIRGDELLIKAREAMISAVHVFNGASLTFRAELFIVTAIIAWTYLFHAWFRREGIDYRHKDKSGNILKTKQGEDKFLELAACLKHVNSPIDSGTKNNLEFLIQIRNEIEHRSTGRIDEALSAKLQACCLNFNDAIKSLFGSHFALERRLPIALQFSSFDVDQRNILKKQNSLPANIASTMDSFHKKLSADEQTDPKFAYRVIFVPKIGGKASNADFAIEFLSPDSEEVIEANKIFLKEIDKKRYTASQIISILKSEGYPKFSMQDHTNLWKSLDAKNPINKFGCVGDYKSTWVWFDSWLNRVRSHCQENSARYK